MTIADVHAIPESEADCAEYLKEGDQAWDGGDPDHAWDLYHSLVQSGFVTSVQRSHASYRLALIAVNRGQTDVAFDFLGWSNEPGTDELKKSLDNATPNDPAPDPDSPPATMEQTDDWWAAGVKAKQAGDWDLARRYFQSIAASTCNAPNAIAKAEVNVGDALHHLGDDENARLWMEKALPNLDDPDAVKLAREMLGGVGVHSTADDSSPAAAQVVAGVEAYQLGDLAAARTALQAALHLDGPDDVKGRAHYYLGAMDYQDKHYAEARNHLEAAATGAPEQERDWATQMLSWHWEEATPTQ
jgi:tetratricopeptide (TPR) repeat protein